MRWPKDRPPTERQREFLTVIRDFREEVGYSPSVRDLAEIFGLSSTNAVADVLRLLERDGCVTRDRRVARSLLLTPKGLAEVSP